MGQDGRRRRHIRAALRLAGRTGELVRLHRTNPGAVGVEGFVVAVGRSWTLLAPLDASVVPDGYTAVRTRDICSVERRAGRHEFPIPVLADRGVWPPPRPPFDLVLASASTIIAGASEVYGLVHLYRDDDAGAPALTGRPVRVRRQRVRVRELTRRTLWRRRTTTWRLRGVSRISFGSALDTALLEYAGQP